MTIRKGEQWGVPVDRPDDLLLVDSDAALARTLVDQPGRPVGPTAGDLHRSLGSPPTRREMQRLSIDLLTCQIGELPAVAVAHVIIRHGWWRGPIVAAMNVDHVGNWNVAPRAHPNDGRFDAVEVDASMTLRERWQARGRLPAGTHVPHPAITTNAVGERSWQFDRTMTVWVDGVNAGHSREVSVTVVPDAGVVFV